MPECYITKRGYQLEYDKPYIGGGGDQNDNFSITCFLDDPYQLMKRFQCVPSLFRD